MNNAKESIVVSFVLVAITFKQGVGMKNEKGLTLTEIIVILSIICLVALIVIMDSGGLEWMNKPIKDMTVKDLLILKFLFD